MANDPGSDRVVLLGGRDDVQGFGDTWAYDYNADTWTPMSPETPPTPRYSSAIAYDAGSDRIILFGGNTVGGGGAWDETWVYDLTNDTWTLAEKGSGPSPRFGPVMVHDTESDRIVPFGGSSGGDETWSLRLVASPSALTWLYVASTVVIGAVAAGVTVVLIRRGKRRRRGES